MMSEWSSPVKEADGAAQRMKPSMARRRVPFPRCPALVIATSLVATPAFSQGAPTNPGDSEVVAILGATLWDGTGAAPVTPSSVVIQGSRIRCAGTPGACPVPPRSRVLDGTGRWLIPGLIDTHVHLFFRTRFGAAGSEFEADLRDLLARGITTVRDMGSDPAALLQQVRGIPGPRVYPMQLVAGTRFFYGREAVHSKDGSTSSYRLPPAQVMIAMGWTPILFRTDDSPDSVVARARAAGAVGLKLYAELTAPEVADLVRAAHRAGLPVWGHAWVQPASVLDQAQAGQDGVVHAAGLAGELFTAEERDTIRGATALLETTAAVATRESAHDPRVTATLDTLARRGTFLEPTLDITLLGADHASVTHSRASTTSDAYARAAEAFGMEVTREAVRRGVRITAGTDHVAYGPSGDRAWLDAELALLVDSIGLTPAAALRAATGNAALAFGDEISAQIGIIAPGRYADLVLLRGDPLRDIRAVALVEWVMQGGVLFRPEVLKGVAGRP
jgi:imidazolonepropionase-like amidohydrolase